MNISKIESPKGNSNLRSTPPRTMGTVWLYFGFFEGESHQPVPLLYPRPTKLEGGYTGFTLSVCPSVRLSVDDMVSGA